MLKVFPDVDDEVWAEFEPEVALFGVEPLLFELAELFPQAVRVPIAMKTVVAMKTAFTFLTVNLPFRFPCE